jgi:hypothetical protein
VTLCWQEETFADALVLRRRLADVLAGVSCTFREKVSAEPPE